MAQPQVEFHTAVPDPIGFACRLLRKAHRQGARLVVMGGSESLGALDRALWTFEEREFVPHLRVGHAPHSPASLALTPIWLCLGPPPQGAPSVLVNLGAEVAPLAERFERMIEIVPDEPAWAQAARERWRRYREAGYPIKHHAARVG